jgi:hypothetical protein
MMINGQSRSEVDVRHYESGEHCGVESRHGENGISLDEEAIEENPTQRILVYT